jgi:hypothetical protein
MDLVGVHLVAQQQQCVRPRIGLLVGHRERHRAERVDLAAAVVLVLAQRVRRLVRRCDAAGAEHDPHLRVPRVGAKDGRRERAVRLWPHDLAVERDLVRNRGVGRQAGDVHERVVVALDGERLLARGVIALGPDLDHARRVGLHPHCRLVLARVPQQWAQPELRHPFATISVCGSLPRCLPSSSPGAVGRRRRAGSARCR